MLCNLIHNHMSQVHRQPNTQAREVAAKFGIAADATIRRPCRDDIHWVTTDPHSPRWEKINQKLNKSEVNSGLFEQIPTNRGLINPFTRQTASTRQSCDLLSFRDVGQREFLNHIPVAFHILVKPSTSATVRKQCFKKFSSKRSTNSVIHN